MKVTRQQDHNDAQTGLSNEIISADKVTRKRRAKQYSDADAYVVQSSVNRRHRTKTAPQIRRM